MYDSRHIYQIYIATLTSSGDFNIRWGLGEDSSDRLGIRPNAAMGMHRPNSKPPWFDSSFWRKDPPVLTNDSSFMSPEIDARLVASSYFNLSLISSSIGM